MTVRELFYFACLKTHQIHLVQGDTEESNILNQIGRAQFNKYMGEEFDAIKFDKEKINVKILSEKEMLYQSAKRTGFEINLEAIITKDRCVDIFKEYNESNLFKSDKEWADFKFRTYSLNNSIKNVRTLIKAGGVFGSRYIMARIKEIHLIKLKYGLEF